MKDRHREGHSFGHASARCGWTLVVLAIALGALACGAPAAPVPAAPPPADTGEILIRSSLGITTLGGVALPSTVDDAAYAPSHRSVVLASAEGHAALSIASSAATAAAARELARTAIDTSIPVAWQWRFDDGEQSLCVVRQASSRIDRPHGPSAAEAAEAERVLWVAIVPLDGSAPTPLAISGRSRLELLGWSGSRCVIAVHAFLDERTYAFDAAHADAPEVTVLGVPRVLATSPRGTMSLTFEGGEGDVRYVLAGAASPRMLLHDDTTRYVTGYAWIGNADVAYAPDDAWVAVRRTEFHAPRFDVSLRVESPDGGRTLYEDAWHTSDDALTRPDLAERAIFDPPSAAPTGQRIQYVRVRSSGELERVVVDLEGGAHPRVLDGDASRPAQLFPEVRPLFSPDGRLLVVVDGAGTIQRYDLSTGAHDALGTLPPGTMWWRW
jgi:hypothetical protein